jgi:PleD family two-component response regulator
VEDEPSVAAVLEETLKTRYRVEVARDGAEGLAKAHALVPELVVMNIFLPRMDGLDAVAALKASSDTADIPVILVSAHRGVADKVRGLNLGAVDYLARPFQSSELLDRVERALHLRRTERELKRSQNLLNQTGRDALTGLHDRIGLGARLHQEVSRARRYGRQLCLARVRLGPLEPSVLQEFGASLRKRLRAPDVIAHLGEGLFVLILTECSALNAQAALSRLLPTLDSPKNPLTPVDCMDVPTGEMPDVVLERLLAL